MFRCLCPARLAILLLVLTSVFTSTVRAAEAEIERALEMFDRLDQAMLTLAYDDEPLARVLDELSEVLPIAVGADWEALEMLGIGYRDTVTLRVRDTSALTALRGLAVQLGDEDLERPFFEVYGGRVVLTTIEGSTAMRMTDVYDLRDLLRDEIVDGLRKDLDPVSESELEPLPAPSAPSVQPPAADEPILPRQPDALPLDIQPAHSALPDIDFESMPDAAPRTPGEDLAYLIMEHVDPEAWYEFGGVRGRIDERDGVLLVTAGASTHRLFRDALRRLRRTSPLALQMDVVMIDTPRKRYEQLTRRFDGAPAALASALVAADGTIRMWGLEAEVKPGEPLRSASRSNGVSVEVEIIPTFESAGVLSLAIHAETAQGDATRMVETKTALAGGRGAVLIELPGATVTDTIRLLVVRTH